ADAAKKFVGHVPSMPVANHGMQLVERAAVLRASRKKLNQSFHRVEHDRWRRAKRPYQRPGSAAPRHGWTDCNPDAIAGFAAAGWFGDVMLTQSQKSPADPDELAVTAGLPLGWECTRETLQTPETPRRPNATEENEGNKDGSALRFLRCLLCKTSEYSSLCTPPNARATRAAQRVGIGNSRGPPAFAPVIWFAHVAPRA